MGQGEAPRAAAYAQKQNLPCPVLCDPDSPWQLPGEFVIDRDGIVQLAHRYQSCEDYPNPWVLTAALKKAGWQRG